MEKIDLKKEYKELYSGKAFELKIVEVPKFKFIKIKGEGDPNKEVYSRKVEALYTIAYSIKFLSKKKEKDFVVAPLEGLWEGEKEKYTTNRNKDSWNYTMMIHMPDFIDEEIFNLAKEQAKEKKELIDLDDVFFQEYEEGTSIQVMYIGPYDDETETIASIEKFMRENGYNHHKVHHEIYLNDPRKVAKEKLKTILRQPIIIP